MDDDRKDSRPLSGDVRVCARCQRKVPVAEGTYVGGGRWCCLACAAVLYSDDDEEADD